MKKNKLLLHILFFIATCIIFSGIIINGDNLPENPGKAQDTNIFSIADALILGIVEGITEYLPVSSTGHLLLTQHIMGLDSSQSSKQAADSYAIIIQIGAILAVLSMYRNRIRQMYNGLMGKNPAGARLIFNLLIGFSPAAITGILFGDIIKAYLFGMWPIIFGWLLGGIAIFFNTGSRIKRSMTSIEDIRWQNALIIGFFQVTAMWPGISRSLATIMGGLIAGLGLSVSLEFSFLLGLITLGSATLYEILGSGVTVMTAYGYFLPLVGILTSFLAAWLSVKWLITYVQNRGLVIFGYYRMLLAATTAMLLLTGVI